MFSKFVIQQEAGQIMIHVKNNPQYYINARALTFSENDLGDPNRVAVSLVSGTVVMVHKKGTIDYASDGSYEKWTLRGYSTKLVKNDKYYIYARLSRTDKTALIVFSVNSYNLDGSITTITGKDEEGNDITETTDPNENYFYVKIGELTETDGSSMRELTYDSGLLGTEQGNEESSPINEMWELSKFSTPWLIRAKQWLSSFTVKGFISLVGGFVFKNGEQEKPVTDIKRSTDSDEDVPVSDENLATSKYVESQLEGIDERFLSKVKPDETPHHIKLLGGLTTTEAASDDYAKDTLKAGWAARKDDDGNWYVEADKIVARILANVYDLLVENNAVFKGNLSSEEFISGFLSGKGWAIRMKEFTNAAGAVEKKSVAEFDDLIVRGSMRIYEFIVSQMLGENDNRIFTGMMEVDHYDAADGKVYLKTDGGKLYNPFRVDDVIIVQQYGGNPSEENGYYVTKQYEFIVTEVGIGEQGEDRLDWVRFRNFTTPMEGGSESLITEMDTLVRLDNLSNADRKGIIQLMSVGQDTPYMDFIYGAKTDPENSLKGRLGNLGGVYNPLFGWLKEFGAYLTNLYAVGEFVIAHTGENVADSIEIAKGQFRTNYRQTTFDMSEEQNFFTNASMTNNCEHWVLGSDATEYFMVDELPQFFNFDLYASEQTYAGLSEWKGRDMLRLSESSIMQSNSLIDKAGTHKVYTGSTENDDGSYTDTYEEVADTLYLSVRFFVSVSGKLEFGFVENGNFIDNSFHYSSNVTAREDGYEVKLSGIWDGKGDFTITSTGDVYVDLLSLTDKPLDNFKITTETKIEQDATRISLLGKKINGVEGSVTDLGIELNAAKEQIRLYVNKVGVLESSVSELEVGVEGIRTTVASVQGTASDAKSLANAAQSAANDAASKALAAQTTANSANSKANANATAIAQTEASISLLAGAFTLQNGKYVLTSAAGAVITSEVASLYATKSTVDSLGKRVTTAESSIKVNADNINLKVSKNGVVAAINASSESVTISANRIDLNGVVTSTAFKNTLSGYATDSELSAAQTALNTSISNLNTTLSTKIDAKASTESLNTKVSELNTAISKKADTSSLGSVAYMNDIAKAACNGSTLIVGGYINADLLNVEKIYAKEGTVGGFSIGEKSLVNEGADAKITIGTGSGKKFVSLNDSTSSSVLYARNDEGSAIGVYTSGSTGVGVRIQAQAGAKAIESYGNCVITARDTELIKVTGLAVATNRSFSGTAKSNMDVIVTNGNTTLPSAATYPGKIYYVKILSGSLTAKNVYLSTSPNVTTEATWTDANSRIFFSDGTFWHEINGV